MVLSDPLKVLPIQPRIETERTIAKAELVQILLSAVHRAFVLVEMVNTKEIIIHRVVHNQPDQVDKKVRQVHMALFKNYPIQFDVQNRRTVIVIVIVTTTKGKTTATTTARLATGLNQTNNNQPEENEEKDLKKNGWLTTIKF